MGGLRSGTSPDGPTRHEIHPRVGHGKALRALGQPWRLRLQVDWDSATLASRWERLGRIETRCRGRKSA